MSLVSKSIPNLSGGISQQAAPLRLAGQCENQVNMRASLVNGLEARAPMKLKTLIDSTLSGSFFPIDRDDDGKYNLVITPTGLVVTDETGARHNVTYESGALAYLAAGTTDPRDRYKSLTLADHTFILNTDVTAQVSFARYNAWANQALVFIKQVQASTTWSLTVNGQTISVGYGGVNNETGLPHLYVNGTVVEENANMSTAAVASRLAGGSPAYTYYEQTTDTVRNAEKDYYYFRGDINEYWPILSDEQWTSQKAQNNVYEKVIVDATTGFSGFTITQKASTLWIRKNDGGAFTIGLSDTRNDTCSHLVTSRVQQFSDLPTVAPDGYIARVVGSVSTGADDYFVMFSTTDGSSFSKGTWAECAEPDSQYALDSSTMPFVLVHTAATAWTMRPVEWGEKLTGNLDTNPLPSFVGKKLRDIFLYRNRLCLLTEDLLCMSRAGEYENFWNETATTLSDADPIYISASTDKVADLCDHAFLDDALILFGRQGQYKLEAQDVLSPKTAAVTVAGHNSYAHGTGITAGGSRLYFGYENGGAFCVQELATEATSGVKVANPLTAHVPNLIPFASSLKLAGEESAQSLAVITDAAPGVIYVYQYYINNGNRLQSAWHRYTLADVRFIGAYFRDNLIWLLGHRYGKTLIFTLDMAERASNDEFALDMAQKLTSRAPTNSWSLPAYYNPASIVVLKKLSNDLWSPEDFTVSDSTISTKSKHTEIIVGEKIDRLYTFSTPYVSTTNRAGAEKVITTGRWQLQKLRLTCGVTGPFTVTVKPKFAITDTPWHYLLTGVNVGQRSAQLGIYPIDSGWYEIPLRGQNTDLEVTITADTHLPTNIISAEWMGMYITKVKQI